MAACLACALLLLTGLSHGATPELSTWTRGDQSTFCLNSDWFAGLPAGIKAKHWARPAHPTPFHQIIDPRFNTTHGPVTVAAYDAKGAGTIWNGNTLLSSGDEASSSVIIERYGWESNGLTAYIDAILLREMVGYNVTVSAASAGAGLDRLSQTGSLASQQPTHVQHEFWKDSRPTELPKWGSEVEQLGPIGFIGHSGAFAPKALVDEYAAKAPAQYLDFWAGLKDSSSGLEDLSLSALPSAQRPYAGYSAGSSDFKCTPGLAPNLGCDNGDGMFYTDACKASSDKEKECALLIFCDPAYDTGYLQASFNNLGIKAAFAFPGWAPSIAYLRTQLNAGRHVLFYWWKPDIFLTEFESKITRIALPISTNECLNKHDQTVAGSGVDCDFPQQQLQKVAHANLWKIAPAAHDYIRSFRLADPEMRDALQMLYAHYNAAGSAALSWDQKMFDVSCEWVRKSYTSWSSHLPPAKKICEAGSYNRFGSLDCTPCPTGTFIPTAGAAEACFPCPKGSYANTTGSTKCHLCPANSNSDAQPGSGVDAGAQAGSFCFCNGADVKSTTGYFRRNADRVNASQVLTQNAAEACEACPYGGLCMGGAVQVNAGYWRSTREVFALSQCTRPEICGRGADAWEGDDICSTNTTGNTGRKCEACSAGGNTSSVFAGSRGVCSECPSSTAILVLSTILSVLLLHVCVYLYCISRLQNPTAPLGNAVTGSDVADALYRRMLIYGGSCMCHQAVDALMLLGIIMRLQSVSLTFQTLGKGGFHGALYSFPESIFAFDSFSIRCLALLQPKAAGLDGPASDYGSGMRYDESFLYVRLLPLLYAIALPALVSRLGLCNRGCKSKAPNGQLPPPLPGSAGQRYEAGHRSDGKVAHAVDSDEGQAVTDGGGGVASGSGQAGGSGHGTGEEPFAEDDDIDLDALEKHLDDAAAAAQRVQPAVDILDDLEALENEVNASPGGVGGAASAASAAPHSESQQPSLQQQSIAHRNGPDLVTIRARNYDIARLDDSFGSGSDDDAEKLASLSRPTQLFGLMLWTFYHLVTIYAVDMCRYEVFEDSLNANRSAAGLILPCECPPFGEEGSCRMTEAPHLQDVEWRQSTCSRWLVVDPDSPFTSLQGQLLSVVFLVGFPVWVLVLLIRHRNNLDSVSIPPVFGFLFRFYLRDGLDTFLDDVMDHKVAESHSQASSKVGWSLVRNNLPDVRQAQRRSSSSSGLNRQSSGRRGSKVHTNPRRMSVGAVFSAAVANANLVQDHAHIEASKVAEMAEKQSRSHLEASKLAEKRLQASRRFPNALERFFTLGLEQITAVVSASPYLWYYEHVLLLRRLGACCIAAFVPEDLQMAIMPPWLVLFLIVHIYVEPFGTNECGLSRALNLTGTLWLLALIGTLLLSASRPGGSGRASGDSVDVNLASRAFVSIAFLCIPILSTYLFYTEVRQRREELVSEMKDVTEQDNNARSAKWANEKMKNDAYKTQDKRKELRDIHFRLTSTLRGGGQEHFETNMREDVIALTDLADKELHRLQLNLKSYLDSYTTLAGRYKFMSEIGFAGGAQAQCEQALRTGTTTEEHLHTLFMQARRVQQDFHDLMAATVEEFNDAAEPLDLNLHRSKFPLRTLQNQHSNDLGFPNAELCLGPLKTLFRCSQKVAHRLDGNCAALFDIVRVAVSFRDPYTVYVFFELLKTISKLTIKRVDNLFLPEATAVHGHRNIVVLVEFKELICEIKMELFAGSIKKDIDRFVSMTKMVFNFDSFLEYLPEANAVVVEAALDSPEAADARESLKKLHAKLMHTLWKHSGQHGFNAIMQPHVQEMMNLADTELKRLEGAMDTVLNAYKSLLGRFDCILEIGKGPVVSCEQFTPPFVNEGASPWGAAMDAQMTHFNWIFEQAELVNEIFQKNVASLCQEFNAAEVARDLNVHIEQDMLPIQNDFAASLGHPNVTHRKGPLKTRKRALFKKDNDYGGKAACLLDIVRAQLIFHGPFSIFAFFEFLKTRTEFTIKRVKNKFLPDFPGIEFGYRDVLVNVEYHGHVCEIQLTLSDLAEIKRQMHPFYKVARVKETQAYGELTNLYSQEKNHM